MLLRQIQSPCEDQQGSNFIQGHHNEDERGEYGGIELRCHVHKKCGLLKLKKE